MNFTHKIEALRNKAQETQAANKIIDMLKHLEAKNDNTTSYRWIWELIQNAKDVANSSGKVDILIEFDEKEKNIKFKHNGKLFSTKNIIFLIEQVSTKERDRLDANVKKTTGKFGTGFLTTHLLSKKVNVSGYLQDDDDKPYSFKIDIDRSSDEQLTIINSIAESCNQLDRNSTEINYVINENEFNTCFTYHLDNNTIRTAKKGLSNLIVSAPYVFAFVPEINSVTVSGVLLEKEFKQTIIRGDTYPTNLENAKVMRINVSTNEKNKERYILTINNCDDFNLTLAVEIYSQNKEKSIQPIHADLPKLFCDFPLLGTNDFPFPVVINSSSFNPTEPRDGIYLTDKGLDSEEPSDIKESKDINENKIIMIKATELYNILLEYFLSHNYKSIYNITKISKPPVKDWLSEAWVNENVINKLKSHIQAIDLIDTHSGNRKPLRNDWDEPCVLIPNHLDEAIRNALWYLSSKLIPEMITKNDELEFWYNSLWDECRNYSVEDLIYKVEEFKNLSTLSDNVSGDTITWLNQFYNLIYANDHAFAKKLNAEPRIIPNQNGDFCTINSLCIDCGIEDKYKEISLTIGLDIKSKLMNKSISTTISHNISMRKYTFDDMVIDFQKALKLHEMDVSDYYTCMICVSSEEAEKQNAFLDIIKDIYKEDSWLIHKVRNFSNELFETALDYWIKKICEDISKCASIENFSRAYHFQDYNITVKWLSNLIVYLVNQKKSLVLNDTSIFPNQNGRFKKISELSLDSDEIDDIVKDVYKVTGEDIRETLLIKDIYYKLSKNQTITNENLAGRITNYIRANKNKLGQTIEEKTIFRSFYFYLSENRSKKCIETAFNELCSNLHWLYNDEDIAHNMQIVDEYNNILSKYGVSSVDELESILIKLNLKEKTLETVEISQEMLAQWGITTDEELQKALASRVIGPEFVYTSGKSIEMFKFVQEILERTKQNVIKHLSEQHEYDLSNITFLSKTIFVVNKHGEQIYIIARPSDYDQVIIYYDFEKDVLDFQKDWELWVENGTDTPQRITFGGILKLTGVNRIPLKRI